MSITVVNEGPPSALRRHRNRLLLSAAALAILAIGFPQGAKAGCVVNGAPPPDYLITNSTTTIELDADCPGAGSGDRTATVSSGVTVTTTSISNPSILDNPGGASWSITNEGTVTSTFVGFFMNNEATVTNAGSITGHDEGIELRGGGTVTNAAAGTILSTNEEGVSAFNTDITVNNSGTITATNDDGIELYAGGTVTNLAGTIEATNSGAGVRIHTSTATVNNSASITGADYGIILEDGGMVTNTATGTISAVNEDGVQITSASGTVDNSGRIESTFSRGVYIDADGTLTNRAGATIEGGGLAGVTVNGATIDNSGTITGSNWGVESTRAGTIINRATGLIEGDDHGILATFPITVENAGTITSATANGIRASGGTVTNTGTIAGDNRGIGNQNDAISVTNSGSITGRSDNGVYSNAGGSVTNLSGGTISGGEDGVLFEFFTGTVTNSGQITSNNDESGVELAAGGTVTNMAGGTITGDAEGVMISGATGTVTNSGTITGLDNFGVTLRAGGTVTNLTGGTIRGDNGLAGVHIQNATGTVDNAGEIYGDDDEGVELTAGGTIINRSGGLIEGEADQAIEVTGGTANVINAGRINSINSGSGIAVQFGGSNDRLEIQPGSSITNDNAGTIEAGIVEAGGGTDTLAFGGTGKGEFDLAAIDTGANIQQYRNFEDFEVVGGEWSFTGATTVAFTQTGGTLKGTGAFGGLTVNGGTIAPGNSIGTLTVNGNFRLRSGAVYEAEVDAAGNSDKIIVNGTVNLTGATLRVLAQNGNYKSRTNYTIIENDGSDAVAGTFGSITTNYAFLTPSVAYDGGDGNDVVLTLMRTVVASGGGGTGYVSFCSVAQSANQCNVAHALDLFPTDNELFLAVLTQTAEGARQAFDALSGEVHASVAGTLADDSRYVRDAVLGRLMQAGHAGEALSAGGPQVASLDQSAMALGYDDKALGANMPAPAPAPLDFWTRAYGAWGDLGGNGNAATADRDLGGFVSGMDAELAGSWRVGLATGASFSNVGVDARYSSADVESYTLGGYAGGMAGAFALRGGGIWAWNSIDTSRAVVFPGFFERQKASYDADTGQLFGEIAYPTRMFGMALEPFGGLAYVSVDSDTIKEHGGALASLRGSADQDVGYTTLGLRAAQTMMWDGMLLTPHLSAAWQHAFDGVTPDAALAFAGTGIGFDVYGVPLAEDSALIDAGLDVAMGPRTTAGVSYAGQFGDRVTDNGVKGRFTWLF